MAVNNVRMDFSQPYPYSESPLAVSSNQPSDVPRLPLPVPTNASTDDNASSEHPIPPMDSKDDEQLVEDTTRLGKQDDAPVNDTDGESKYLLIIVYN